MRTEDDQATSAGEPPSTPVTTELLAIEATLPPKKSDEIASDGLGEPSPRRWLIFSIVAAGMMMGSLDASIVATALHSIANGLHAQLNWSAWTISAYSLGRVVSLPIMGKIGDKYGRRRIFVYSIVLFGVSSLLCGLATNIYMLDGLRFIQAIGGGAFIPSSTAIVAKQFGRDRDRAVALFSSIVPIGGIIGPIFGGLFVAYWTWRGIFFINVPVCILLIPLAIRFVPESRPGAKEPNDYRGITLLVTCISLFAYGITELGNGNVTLASPSFFVPIMVSLFVGAGFFHHIRLVKYPVIPRRFLIGKGFGAINTVNTIFGAGVLGFGSLVPLYAQDRFHIAVLSSGTLLTARGVGGVSIAGITAYMLRKTGTRIPMMVGFSLTGLGILMSTIPPHGLGIYGWLVMSTAITGFGMGMTTPATGNAGMHLAPESAGSIGGLRAMFRLIGSVIAVSIVSAIVTRSSHPGLAEEHVFFVFSLMCFATVPFLFRVPDGRGRW